MPEPLRILAMASGGGRTIVNLHEHIAAGHLAGVGLHHVFVSRADCAAVERCEALGLQVHLPGEEVDAAAAACIDAVAPDLVLLCGYLRYLPVTSALEHRVMNIHPSLLPAHGGKGMYGHHVHAAVLEAGDRQSGCTVHLVDEAFDNGPVVLQRTCNVHESDDVDALAARVFQQECAALPEAVALAAAGRLRLHNGIVEIAPEGETWPAPLFRRN